jgi:hypothetical protein
MRRLVSLGLLTAGGGAAVRSLIGLKDMVAKSYGKRKPPTHPAVVEVGVPEVVEEDAPPEAQRAAPSLGAKFAGDGVYIPPTEGQAPDMRSTVLDWLKGRTHTDIWSKPWVPIAATGAAIGGGYAGYKGVDALLGRLHKNDQTQDLEEAKEDYRKALLEQYTPDSPAVKHAGASELGKDLNTLFDLVKTAGTVNDLAGIGVGGYLPLAALLAGGTGAATYNWVKSRSPEERLAKAIKQRERLRWATRPPEIYAVTKPRPVRLSQEPAQTTFGAASEQDEADVRKIAAEVGAMYKP